MVARHPWRIGAGRRSGHWRRQLGLGVVSAALIATAMAAPASADPIFPAPVGQPEAPPDQGTGLGTFHAVVPARVRDTRSGTGGPAGALAAGGTAVVDVTGIAGVPDSGVAAVVANVTVTEPTTPGFLTVYPSGADRPLASNLNFVAGQNVPNLVTVQVGADGNIAVFNGSTGTAHVIVDITGWYEAWTADSSTAGTQNLLRSVVPARVRDTRNGTGGAAGALAPGATSVVDVTGIGGVPEAGVVAVVANVTVTEPTAPGFLTVYPSGADRPLASNLNFVAGQNVPNLVTVQVGADGNIAVFNGSTGTAHVIIDITGWYGVGDPSSGGLFRALVPARVRDTRNGTGGAAGALAPGATAVVDVTGIGGVPEAGVAAVVANVTVTEPTTPGFLTVYPSGADRPLASNLNFVAGQNVPNLVTVQVGADGNVAVFNGSTGTAHVIIDITGYFTAGDSGSTPKDGTTLSSTLTATSLSGIAAKATPIDDRYRLGVRPDLHDFEVALAADTVTGTAGGLSAADTTAWPVGDWGYPQTPADPAIGRLFGVDGGKVTGTCSGTVVARNLVITAAHCVNHTGYSFAPQQYGKSVPYGYWYATAYFVAPQYQGGANQGADFAFLVFNDPDSSGYLIGDRVGWFGIASDPPGGLKYAMGYPSEGYFNKYCSAIEDCYPVFCASTLNSAAQYVREAVDASVSYGAWWSQSFGCYMTGGSSGGPVFQQINGKWYVVGVNSHVDFGPTYTDSCFRKTGVCGWYSLNMYAPYFNQAVIDDWTSLHAA